MVETTIRTVDANVSFKGMNASRGKITRAEPIAALSEQHRILFLGAFPELEDQLCTFEAGSADSPDRLDALVWAFTELMVEFQVPDIPIVMPVIISKAEAGSSIPGSPYYVSGELSAAYRDKRQQGFSRRIPF